MLETGKKLWANRWVQVSLGAIVSVGLAYVAVNRLAWREVGDTFRHFPIDYAVWSTVPLILAMILRAVRWSVLLQKQDISFFHVLITQNAGIGLNTMLLGQELQIEHS